MNGRTVMMAGRTGFATAATVVILIGAVVLLVVVEVIALVRQR